MKDETRCSRMGSRSSPNQTTAGRSSPTRPRAAHSSQRGGSPRYSRSSANGSRLVFLAVGTSGLVYPAAGMVLQARAAGAEAWLVNTEPPDNVRAFHHFAQGPSGQVLPSLFEWA